MQRDRLDPGTAVVETGIQVSLLQPSEFQRWDEFVGALPGGYVLSPCRVAERDREGLWP